MSITVAAKAGGEVAKTEGKKSGKSERIQGGNWGEKMEIGDPLKLCSDGGRK